MYLGQYHCLLFCVLFYRQLIIPCEEYNNSGLISEALSSASIATHLGQHVWNIRFFEWNVRFFVFSFPRRVFFCFFRIRGSQRNQPVSSQKGTSKSSKRNSVRQLSEPKPKPELKPKTGTKAKTGAEAKPELKATPELKLN